MTGGMRDLDRAIGALSTLVVGVGFLVVRPPLFAYSSLASPRAAAHWTRRLQVRELFREKDARSKWEKCATSESGTDVYFQCVLLSCV